MKGRAVNILRFLFVILTLGPMLVPAQSSLESTRSAKPSPTPNSSGTAVSPEAAKPNASNDNEVIRVNTQLVSIPVRVMDRDGRFTAGLTRNNFKVFVDGAEQQVAMFSNEEQPFTVAMVLDMSYSTKFKIDDIQSAAIAFIDQLRPQDKVMVVSFDDDVHILSEPTNDREATYDAIRSTKIATGTSLYEALDVVMKSQLKHIEGRKAIILFTDGVDTTSRRTSAVRNLNDAMELDSLIYPIRYDTYWDVQRMKSDTGLPRPPPLPRTLPAQSDIILPFPFPTKGRQTVEGTTLEDYKVAREYLDELAFRTGGRVYQADNLHKLTEGFANIAGELREFYSLGIYPDDAEPGTLRNVRVRIDRPGLVVRSRDTFRTGQNTPGK